MVRKKNKNPLPYKDLPYRDVTHDKKTSNGNALRKKPLFASFCLATFFLLASAQLPAEIWGEELNVSALPADMAGFASLTGAYLLGILLLAPLSPFALAAGGLFGFWWGTVLALVALNGGAALAFLIARHLLPQRLTQRLQKGDGLAIWARALSGNGIGTIALLRLNPVVPFNLQNYVCGASGVNFAPYSLGTFIGAAPCTIALVYLGHAGRRLFLTTGLPVEQWNFLIFISAAVLTLPLTFSVVRKTVKRLRECRTNEQTATDKE